VTTGPNTLTNYQRIIKVENNIKRILINLPKSEEQSRKILEDFWEEAYNKGLEDGKCDTCRDIAWQIQRGL